MAWSLTGHRSAIVAPETLGSMGALLRRFLLCLTVITTQLDFAPFRVLGNRRSLIAPVGYYVIRSCYQPVIHAVCGVVIVAALRLFAM